MNPQYPLVALGAACVFAISVSRAALAQAPHPPCTMLTPAQVGAIVGDKVGAGTAIGSTGCQWAGPKVRATLVFWPAEAFNGMKAPLGNVPKTHASGIGDDAVYATFGPLTTLGVLKGKVSFVVRLYGVHDTQQQITMEKALALDVIARM